MAYQAPMAYLNVKFHSFFEIVGNHPFIFTIQLYMFNTARGVMIIVVENGHGDTSSNPGPDWLHFT